MPPSSASGFSGAARVQRLDLAGIEAAEKHGKRLDWSSMQRHVRSVEPLVWPEPDGLDLMALYEKHIEGVFVPSGQTKMLHNIVQFPKGLISEDEPGRMLEGARNFIESVYGPESVVAARIDQDEKGRHVVDVFVVPIYEKKTKHTTKRAVSISKQLKDLAKKHGMVDEYNQRVEEKNALKSADRAGLRGSLIRNKLENPVLLRSAQNGISDRSDLTRLFTRDRGNKSRRSAAAVAGVQRLPERELAQDERNDARLLVQRAGRVGVHQQPLDRGVRYQVVTLEGGRPEAVPDHTGKAARGRDPVGRKPVRAGAPGALISDPNLFMQGVALQSELHLFLRDEMGLEGVQRGRQKKAIGPDWLAAEQLDIQRKREAVEAALTAKEAALAAKEAADLVTSQAMQTVVELQLATGAKKNAEADALLAGVKSLEAELVTSKRQAKAFSAGMAAWSDGDLTAAQKDGVKSVNYRDVATKERLWPVIEPAISQLWEWMTEAAATVAKAVADRVAELVKAATAEREQAAKDRVAASAQADATKTEADRVAWLVKAATNDRQQAAKDRADAAVIKEQAGALLAQAEAWEAETIADKRHARALGVGVEAWVAGDVRPVQKEDGSKSMKYRDVATKDRIAPVVRPVFDQLWEWMMQAAQAVADRLAKLAKDASDDRKEAAFELSLARLDGEQAESLNEALQTRLEALETSEGMKRAIDAKITPKAVQDAVAAYVTPELIQQVVRRQVTEAQAVNSASAMFAQRQRDQGR